jgi:LytS/YehU family sensor histidine kinase
MQAQVEPQFLFDTLVGVQATYDRDTATGATVMDRLINYLRVALPRLREQGSTVQAEAELLAAYVAVVAARHGGRPAVQFVVAPEAAGARFYPMLLLPLVQRAMRVAQREQDRVPERIELVVKRHGEELGVLLRIEAAGLCDDDPELARVRERLAGLYAARAQLVCKEISGFTEFVLRVPL